AVARLARVRRITSRTSSTYDVLLTPTLADVTPRIGHLDPTSDYQQIIDRLVEWVAFTPLQNATGEPSVSLPLAESESGLPVGMMFSAAVGQDARLLELAFELEEARPWRRIAG
ncbi:MAG: amidase family protein, partial [Mycobacterium sp.]